MLNCCIQKKIQRETLYKGYTSQSNIDSNSSDTDVENCENKNRTEACAKAIARQNSDSSSADDDEFYECEDSPSKSQSELEKDIDEKEDNSEQMDMSISESSSYTDSVSHKPEGQLSPCNDLKLLNTGDQLYIPVTQEPAPMTEDMLEEHAEILAKFVF